MKSIVSTLSLLLIMAGSINAQQMEQQIINSVKQVFEAADARNWPQVADAFASQVLLDYTSMAGGEPVTLTPDQIVGSWKGLLPGFDKTRHMIHDFEVSIDGSKARVAHDGTANHYLNGETWTVVGNYELELIQQAGEWKVNAMKFNMEFMDGNTDLPRLAKEKVEGTLVDNSEVVDRFFQALEDQEFEVLKEVFAHDGRQLNPYIPEGFPASFDGNEAIYQQYSGLTENFGSMRFPRQIYTTSDPDLIFVRFSGEIEIKAGGQYKNDYLGLFRLENGQITEYIEYFNPIVMAKAFGITLK